VSAVAKQQTSADEAAAIDKPDKTVKSGKKRIVVAVLLLLVGGGAFVTMRGAGAHPGAKPQPGAVVALDPLTVNLQDGHYLRVGLALQVAKGESLLPDAPADAPADPQVEGAKALDQAIAIFGRGTMASLTGAGRVQAKRALISRLKKVYDGAVIDVYFTEFVMQ
jgi:flagellar FliL protein